LITFYLFIFLITIHGAKKFISLTQCTIKFQGDTINVLNSGRFDITTDGKYLA